MWSEWSRDLDNQDAQPQLESPPFGQRSSLVDSPLFEGHVLRCEAFGASPEDALRHEPVCQSVAAAGGP